MSDFAGRKEKRIIIVSTTWRKRTNAKKKPNYKHHVYMLWFNFILGLNFTLIDSKLITIHFHTLKQRRAKFN